MFHSQVDWTRTREVSQNLIRSMVPLHSIDTSSTLKLKITFILSLMVRFIMVSYKSWKVKSKEIKARVLCCLTAEWHF